MENNLSFGARDPSKPRDLHAYRSGTYLRAHIFLGLTIALVTTFKWPLRWALSGTPTLTYILWLGEANGCRIQPPIPLWTMIIFINLVYSVATTSWLLFGIYIPACYLTIFVASLYQFDLAAHALRTVLGSILKQPRFINDRIAFLNLPALEIDVDVKGLLVVRGVTFSLLHLNIIAHGIEVGIKISDDMEIALHVDEVKISLFRRIDIGEVYGNLKGGKGEMTLEHALTDVETSKPPLGVDNAASITGLKNDNGFRADLVQRVSTIEKLTDGNPPKDVSAGDGLASITQISPDEEQATVTYTNALSRMEETSPIAESKRKVEAMARNTSDAKSDAFNPDDKKDMRAAICTQLHDTASVPFPPPNSIKVTTLRNLSPPYIRRFLHRLPFLLRLLLKAIAYFHPVHIDSVTAGLSGKWLRQLLHDLVFKGHAENDTGTRRLEARIKAWLADANFVLEITSILGLAQIPLSTVFDIDTRLKVQDVMLYRTLPQEVAMKQVVRLAGADASVTIPSFLLPHHEHVLPQIPNEQDREKQEEKVVEADGLPKAIHAQEELEQTAKDETNIDISAHARLPAVFDQELLDFIAAVIKTTKMIEIEHGNTVDDAVDKVVEDVSDTDSVSSFSSDIKAKKRSIKDWTRAMGTTVSNNARRVAVDAVTNDRWIAKMVGKITRRLESTKGDLGYSGAIPVPLAPYRALAEDATKLLP
ncbi:hypothetical protein LTR84_003514 [Exophiala bonariae]|uniref:SMP-LTD domain-containing protein n=1 Tax=Exophiala bonariae TaxID=1690606 RepID=A0AAV9N750_9EURO|nr:hypothetical protein LTR84_003514 [Exophiala bonariae]